MNHEKKFKFVSLVFIYIPMVIGANLLLYFLGKVPNGLMNVGPKNYFTINLSIMIGLIIGYLLIKWRIKRKNKVPIADERTLKMMKNYLLVVVYIVFIVSSIILMTLFLMGIETIEIGWIFGYISALIILTLIGGAIVSRA